MIRHKKSDKEKAKNQNGSKLGDLEANKILAALAEVGDVTVREVMIPRVDVVALSIPVTEQDVKWALRRTNHSRFPVYDEDLDHLVGVLFVKDLLRDERWWPKADGSREGMSSLDISRKLRPPYLVPMSRQILELMAEMRQRRRDFAVVVDEYGGVAGVLTMKDILGTLVGNLPDEFDPIEPPPITRVDHSRWLIDGSTSVDEMRREFDLPIQDGEYVTIAGYLLERLGKIPEEGETVKVGEVELKIIEMDRHRIAKLVAQKVESPEERMVD